LRADNEEKSLFAIIKINIKYKGGVYVAGFLQNFEKQIISIEPVAILGNRHSAPDAESHEIADQARNDVRFDKI